MHVEVLDRGTKSCGAGKHAFTQVSGWYMVGRSKPDFRAGTQEVRLIERCERCSARRSSVKHLLRGADEVDVEFDAVRGEFVGGSD